MRGFWKSSRRSIRHGLAATATTTIMGVIAAGDNKINLLKYSAGSIANLAGDIQAGSQFYVTVTYLFN